MSLNVLLAPMGTPGDVQPFMDLGIALRRRGHRVALVANAFFRQWAGAAKIDFIELGTLAEYERFLSDKSLWSLRKASRTFAKRLAVPAIKPLYDIIARESAAGLTVVAAQTMALGARLAQEKLGVPLVTLHRQPSVLRSVYQSAHAPYLFLSDRVPRFLKRLQFAIVDLLLDHSFVKPLNAVRGDLRLPPVRRFAQRWMHSPTAVAGVWPDWFAAPQPDWPPNTRLVGFILQTRGEADPPDELKRFIAAGPPPIIFTVGSGMMHGQKFYRRSIEVCQLLGRRGVLVTRFRDQLPEHIPENICHAPYAPFMWLLPRSAAIVHHAGIGTVAQALEAGIPQLSLPGLVFDTFDTAERLHVLGVGLNVPIRQYRPPAVAEKLRELLTSPAIAARCQEISQQVRQSRAIDETCALIERTAVSAFPTAPIGTITS